MNREQIDAIIKYVDAKIKYEHASLHSSRSLAILDPCHPEHIVLCPDRD